VARGHGMNILGREGESTLGYIGAAGGSYI